jgi:hypothetical protein
MTVKKFENKRAVKQLNNSIKLLEVSPNHRILALSQMALNILESLGSGATATEAAKQCRCTKANITYWSQKFMKSGMLRLQTRDVFKLYSLTPYGSKILTTSDSRDPVVLEDYAVKYSVLQNETSPIDWKKLGEPNNWIKMGVKIGDVRVVKNIGLETTVIIHPGKMYGFDVDDLEVDAGRVISDVRRILSEQFGMVLSEQGTPLHKPIYRIYTEEAKEDVKHGTCVVEGVGTIDNSPPEHIPHEEYTSKERIKQRIMLPDSVKSLSDKVNAVTSQLAILTASMSQMAGDLGKITNLLTSAMEQPSIPKLGPNFVERY